MKRSEAQSIKEVIDNYLQSHNLSDKLLEIRALELWPLIVGQAINRCTVERRVDDGVMRVRISSAAMRHELQMHRSTLVKSINDALGKEVIRELRFN